MPLPRTLNSYLDIKRIADSVIEHQSPCTVAFGTKSECTRWCQRFYTYRSLLLKEQQRLQAPHPSTPYDGLIVKKASDHLSARIEFIDSGAVSVAFDNPEATILPLAASPIGEPAVAVSEDDDLLAFARKFGGKLDT